MCIPPVPEHDLHVSSQKQECERMVMKQELSDQSN